MTAVHAYELAVVVALTVAYAAFQYLAWWLCMYAGGGE